MNKFLEKCNLPRLNHEEIKNLNGRINIKEIESVIKILPTKKKPGPDGEFNQIFTEELAPTYLKLFQNIVEPSLHPKDKSYLNMVYDPINVQMNSIW